MPGAPLGEENPLPFFRDPQVDRTVTVLPSVPEEKRAGFGAGAGFGKSIAVSGLTFYTGAKYPGWTNNLFVAALAGQQIRRLEVSGAKVSHQEVVFEQFGRVRAVTTGPDGLLYVLLQNPTGSGTGLGLAASTPGMVIRLVPTK